MIKARAERVDGRVYWTSGSPPRGAHRDALVHLLPIYDEYLVAYRDREAVPHMTLPNAPGTRPFVTFQHTLVIKGQVAGTWRTAKRAQGVDVSVTPIRRLSRKERDALKQTIDRYKRFVAGGSAG
jgi:hypothetical protein